jgi:signal peptidase II
MRRRWIMLLVIVTLMTLMLLVDQVTKAWVIESVPLGVPTQPVPALAPFFQVTYSQNMGAAFGFLPQARDIFPVINIIILLVILYFYARVPANGHLTRFAMGLICGGALGNVLDRLQHGFVVDFIHYQIPGVISNVSNLADHAIVLGVILIYVDSWLMDRKAKRSAGLENVALEADTGDET